MSTKSNETKTNQIKYFPEHLLNVPGFISEYMDYTQRSTSEFNPTVTFAGGLSLLSFLIGRKLQTYSGVMSNLFILGIGNGSGQIVKDINVKILAEIGLISNLSLSFSSDLGIEDYYANHPTLYFQNEELSLYLESIGKDKTNRCNRKMGYLTNVYNSNGSYIALRQKANHEASPLLKHPFLSILGITDISTYYEAMSTKMLNDPFFSKMLVFEGEVLPFGFEFDSSIKPIPETILETATYWARFGNAESYESKAINVPMIEEAEECLTHFLLKARNSITEFEKKDYSLTSSTFRQVGKQCQKLALLYASSKGAKEGLCIDQESMVWATEVMEHQIQRTIYLASIYPSTSTSTRERNNILKKIPSDTIGVQHSKLLHNSKLKGKEFGLHINALIELKEIEQVFHPFSKKKAAFYRKFEKN